MTYLVVANTVVSGLLALLVVGLLRSHALILRDLASVASSAGGTGVADQSTAIEERGTTAISAQEPSERVQGLSLAKVEGFSLDLEPAAWTIRGHAKPTLLAFLSAGCLTCAEFWRDLGAPDQLGEDIGDVDVVIVTKDRAEENLGRLRKLWSGTPPVLMASDVWEQLEIPGSPFFMLFDPATATALGAGSANSWKQLASLVRDFLDEIEVAEAGAGSKRNRVEVENDLLAAAGIRPDHPSLYDKGEPALADNSSS